MIKSEDISIVVQGAINKSETIKCLKSIKKYLPNAEIILSTWEDSDVKDLNGLYNILVLNKDPGFGYYYKTDKKVKLNNLNRQLVSTKEGLKRATKKYAMKIRSDMIFTNNTFLNFFDMYQERIDEYKLFERKVLTSTVCSRFSFNDYVEGNRIKTVNLAFHISDWWFLGLKADIEKYFDVSLVKEPVFSNYYKLDENKDKFNPYIYLEESYLQFAPEQYIAKECFSSNFNDIAIEHAGDINNKIIEQSRKCLINNFIFLEYCDSGIYLNKYFISKCAWLSPAYFDLYNTYRQKYEYNKFCDNSYYIDNCLTFLNENVNFRNDVRELLIHFHRMLGRKPYKKNFFKEFVITFKLGIVFLFKYFQVFILLLIYNKLYKRRCDV